VLDFQPSLKIQNQYNNKLLEKLIKLRTGCHASLPLAEKMSADVARFFSPGVIWSKLPKEERSDFLIANQLYTSFKEYLNLYLEILFESKEANMELQKELIKGQNNYQIYNYFIKMDFRILLVITPIVFSWIFTVFWLGRWDVFRLTPLGLPKKGVAPFKNYQVWEDSALIPDTGRPAEGYPVFTVRTAAVNALGIQTVFFLGAILAMQFKSY